MTPTNPHSPTPPAHPLLDGPTLRALRLAAGHTERGLARTLGTTALRIRRLEAGHGAEHLTLGFLTRLAATLHTTPAELLAPAPPAATTTVGAGSGPARALTLPEARALHRVLTGDRRLAGRGPHGTAQRHLLATGVLTLERPHPDTAAVVALSAPTAAELGTQPAAGSGEGATAG